MKHLFTLKSLMLTLVMLCGLNAWGETETFNFVGWEFDGASKWDSNYSKRTISGSAYKVEFASANKNTSTIKDRPVTKGGDIIVSPLSSDVTITGVELTLTKWKTKTQTVTLNVSSDGTNFTATQTKSSNFSLSASELDTKAVKFTFSSSNNQVGVESIEVTYTTAGGGEAVTVAKPTFSPTGGTYYAAQEVTIQIPDGAEGVMYTTNGDVPSYANSVGELITENTTIPVSKTTTIKAIAVDNSYNESAVAEATYTILPSIANTKETALTVAEAKNLIDNTSADQLAAEKVYVKGTISKIDSYNSTYKSITYWLDNDAFQVYSGKGLDNADFSAKTDLEIGASVIVYGNIKKYNSTYEFDKNNYLVKYTQVTVQSIAINGEATKTEYEAGETFSTAGLEVIATMSDGSTADVTSSAAWTFDPETLAVGTTTVKVTATYQEFSASKDVNVTVVAAIPSVTLDLTTTTQCTVETADKLEWNVSDIVTVTVDKASDSQTAATNYYPGAGNEYTRFYAKHSLTFTPAANYSIASITYNAKTTGYATALASSTWTNATATADNETVTIVPTDGTQPIVATISATTGATSMVIKYKETPIATEEGLDAVLLGEVGKKYQINTTLRVNYKDANYVYASTTKGGFTKTAPTEAQKEEWWSDKAADFNQNDWVAIQGLVDVQVGAEIEAGSVATLVSNDAFPVVEFVTESHTTGTAIEANTYRVANFVDSDNELVKKLWLVDPQPAEHCFVKGYVASLEDVLVDADAGVGLAEIKSGEKDVVTMYVNYKTTDFSITATGWYRFEGIVVSTTSGLELNAVNVNEGTATGVEGVETSSVKVYGAEGVINVESEEVAPIAVYSANGAIVSSVEASSASIAVAPGFYIVKAGNSVSKVTVK